MTLKLPYVSEYISEQILKFVKNHNLPISIVFLPGKKLGELFCCSRPYDKKRCTLTSCMICPKLTEGTSYATMCPVYLITCKICQQQYVGESCRSVHDRLSEHLRYATNADSPSYKEEAMAIHHRQFHSGIAPDLSFKLIRTESNTILRKIYEAYFIFNLKPKMNDKEECKLLQTLLVKGDVIILNN